MIPLVFVSWRSYDSEEITEDSKELCLVDDEDNENDVDDEDDDEVSKQINYETE